MNAELLIDRLDLAPHPEGGWFRQTYESKEKVDLPGFDGARYYSTAIYFLLTSENFSAFHRLRQDEVWHYYAGSPLYVHVIDKNGNYTRYKVGININDGEFPQLTVKAGDWFGSSVVDTHSFSLVGCTVAPGFDYNDFEMAKREEMLRQFPQHKDIIVRLTRT